MNPLLTNSTLNHEAIDYDSIKAEHFLPALEEAIKIAKQGYEEIKSEKNISFESIIEKAEEATSRLDQITDIYYALYGAECTDEINEISEKVSDMLTAFSSDISLDADIFAKYKALYDKSSELSLTKEQKTLLEDSYKSFTRNGALLDDEGKKRLRVIDEELSKLSLKFSDNGRLATNEYVLFANENDVKGMPAGVLEAAKACAKEKGQEDKYAFTLHFPSFYPFMQYCQNRELRKEMYMASSSKCIDGKYSNTENIKKTLKLREERAKLLGYTNHAEFVLEKRMAKKPDTVMKFLNKLLEKAMPQAKVEFDNLKEFFEKETGKDDFQKYDAPFYVEKYKKATLDFDDEELRPYFKLENVINGVFDVASKLYGLNFKELNDIPKYHTDVKTYEITDEKGLVGILYADFFPRETKRSGAWMTDIRKQGLQFGEIKRPLVSIVCNFTKPTESKPSLLTLNEVETLFHEFGHALHGLLSRCKYRSTAGTSVLWDFVELPSQIMENWATEKDVLSMYATHYETGEKMPDELIEKIKKSSTFLEGLGTLRQLSFGFLDMAYHSSKASDINDVIKFEADIMKKFDLYPAISNTSMSCSFGHIFAGGYAAGYYSYKWAEVLDADAFEAFKEKGLFDQGVAKSFKENILEKGGSDDPSELYRRFRGRDADEDALLRRSGLI
jgi:peptidyl-dipeptidase Dcp